MPERVTQRERGAVVGGRYELVALVGTGGMGEVWRAHDTRLRREVAVKLLGRSASDQPGARRRFVAEARAACVIHPHIVSVFDFGEEPTPYIVMELLDGRTLADDLARGPLSNDDVKIVGDHVLDALSRAHARGLLHRDLKPGNVLWAGPATWKVADFGIATSIPSGRDDDTTVPMFGTRGYVSPERAGGAPPSVADDLFAVGVLLQTAAGDDADDALRATIARAIAADPTQRFPTADAMRASLDADVTASSEPTRPTPTTPMPTTPMTATSVPRRPRRGLALVAFLFAVALATAGAVELGHRDHHAGASPPSSVATTIAPTTVAPVTTAAPPKPEPTAPPPAKKGHKHHHPPHGGGG